MKIYKILITLYYLSMISSLFCGCQKKQDDDVSMSSETFQIRARFWYKSSIDKESYQNTYNEWKKFNYNFYRFLGFDKKEGIWQATDENLSAVLITDQDIKEAGFIKTIINEPNFKKTGSVLLTLTSKLPAGWEGVPVGSGNYDFLACLRIDPDPNEIEFLPDKSPSFPEGILDEEMKVKSE